MGTVIVQEEYWRHQLVTVRPVTVVEDSEQVLALFSHAGGAYRSGAMRGRQHITLEERLCVYLSDQQPELRDGITRVHADSGTVTTVSLPGDDPARITSVVAQTPIQLRPTLEGRHAIASFDLEQRRYREYPTPTAQSSPFGLAADAKGRLWFTELNDHRIGRFDPTTEAFQEYELPLEGLHPYLLAVGQDGRIWFTVIDRPLVGVLEPESGEVALMPVADAGTPNGTTGIAVAPDGGIWFGTLRGALGRVDPTSLAVERVASPEPLIYGVTAATDGKIWLATTGDRIYAFTPSSRAFCPLPTGDGARWLALGDDGTIWVSEGIGSTNALGRVSAERATTVCPQG